jgi:hypothetical protein
MQRNLPPSVERQENDSVIPLSSHAVRRSSGTNASEQYLAELSDRTFLTLWSYPNIYRSQDRKEVCDLLVVFEKDIIIFSDKHVEYKPHVDSKVAWRRWYKSAVKESAKQIYGAEQWIKKYPESLFLDPLCIQRFPLPIPEPERMRVHRIVVAHGVSEACRYALGGSGSLMIVPSVIGDDHLLLGDDRVVLMEGRLTLPSPARPFTIGQIDPSKGFVHVLDDTTLDVLLRTLDTVKDFVEYLVRKERLIAAGKLGFAAGEEDLLAYYLRQIGPDGWHDFILPRGMDFIGIDEGLWHSYQQHPQRLDQLQADKISYLWDGLIERFNKNILNDTQYETTGGGVAHSERSVRFLAREPRTRRRFLTEAFVDLYRSMDAQTWKVRVIEPSSPGDPYFLFLVMRHPNGVSYQDYRQARRHCLEEYLQVVKIRYPEAKDIVGIGTGPPDDEDSAEDLLYLDAREWTEEHQHEAERLQQETGFLTRTIRREGKVKAYPDVALRPDSQSGKAAKGRDRNKLCHCGSNRKFKRCHGR